MMIMPISDKNHKIKKWLLKMIKFNNLKNSFYIIFMK